MQFPQSKRFEKKEISATPGPNQYNLKCNLLSEDQNKHFGFIEKSKRFKIKPLEQEQENQENMQPTVNATTVKPIRRMASKDDKDEVIRLKAEIEKLKTVFETQEIGYRKNISKYEQEIQRLDNNLRLLQQEKSALSSLIKSKESEVSELKHKESLLKINVDDCEKQLLKQKGTISQQNFSIETLEEEKKDLLKKMHILSGKNISLTEELEKAKSNLIAELRNHKDLILQLKLRISDLEASVAQLNTSNAQKSKETLTLQEDLNSAMHKIKELAKQLENLREQSTSDTTNFNNSKEILNTKISSLEDQLCQLRSSKDSITTELQNKALKMEESIIASQQELNSRDSIISALKTEHSSMLDELEQKKLLFLELNDNLISLQQEIISKSSIINSFTTTVEEKDAAITNLQSAFKESQTELVTLKNQTTAVLQTVETACNKKIEEKTNQMKQLESKLSESLTEVEELGEQKKKLEFDVLELNNKLNIVTDSNVNLNDKIKEMETDNNTLQADFSKMLVEFDNYKHHTTLDLANVRKNLFELRSLNSEKDREICCKNDEINCLRSEVSELKEKVSSLNDCNLNASNDMENFAFKLKEAMGVIKEKDNLIIKFETEIQVLKTQKEVIHASLTNFAQGLEEVSKEKTILIDELAIQKKFQNDLLSKLETLQKQQVAESIQTEELTSFLNQTESLLQVEKNANTELNLKIANLETFLNTEINNHNLNTEKIKKEIENKTSEICTLKETIRKSEVLFCEKEREFEAMKNNNLKSLECYEEKLNSLKNENLRLNNSFGEEVEKLRSSHQNEINNLHLESKNKLDLVNDKYSLLEDSSKNLNLELSSKQSEIKELSNFIKLSDSKVKTLEHENGKLEVELSNIKIKLFDADSECQNLVETVRELQNKLISNENILKQKVEEMKVSTEAQLKELNKKNLMLIEKRNLEKEKFELTVSVQKKEFQEEKIIISKASEKKIQELQSEKEQLEKTFINLKIEIANLIEQQRTSEAEEKEYKVLVKKRTEQLLKEKEFMEEKNSLLLEKNAQLECSIIEISEKLEDKEKCKVKLEKKLEELNSSLKEFASELTSSQNDFKTLSAQSIQDRENSTKLIGELRQSIQSTKEDNLKLNAKLRISLEDLEAEKKKLQMQTESFNVSKMEIEQLKSTLERKEKEVGEITLTINNMIATQKNESLTNKKIIEELKENNLKSVEEKKIMERNLEEKVKLINQLKSKVHVAELTFQTVHNQKDTEIKSLEEQLKIKRESFLKVEEDLRKLELIKSEKNDLQYDFEKLQRKNFELEKIVEGVKYKFQEERRVNQEKEHLIEAEYKTLKQDRDRELNEIKKKHQKELGKLEAALIAYKHTEEYLTQELCDASKAQGDAGHSNTRQKIKVFERLKEDNIKIKKEKETLKLNNDDLKRKLMALEREMESLKSVNNGKPVMSKAQRTFREKNENNNELAIIANECTRNDGLIDQENLLSLE
ncbi:hypothetical protein HK099_003336 [Clydaea vesicula]|uniref:Uncharacterized protein n=1 Tax=Clydaea vesicula TaxID=447962 RepID=A0AAD5UB44_9FUNG|nr:hypothetical protein HK099_003336 [Clydaea vesicula]